jgi:uncharacterized membrane protein YjgN (DUF898 family)
MSENPGVTTNAKPNSLKESEFDGGVISFIGWSILSSLIMIFTLGICAPWAVCIIAGWFINHTIINGKRLKFTGSAVNLFVHWILWWFLGIITLGIYYFWAGIAMYKWVIKNTSFEDAQ